MTQTSPAATQIASTVRHRSFAALKQHPPLLISGNRHWRMRGQNFFVELVEAGTSPFTVDSQAEMFLIFPDVGGQVFNSEGHTLAQPGAGSVCVLPAGCFSVRLASEGSCAVIASQRSDIDAASEINAEAYRVPDPRVKPAGRPYARQGDKAEVRIFDMSIVPAPADSPRLKMLQTDTLSINWVQYHGVRDRTALSPHSHTDFEQGSLALAGDFVHHLRVDWGKNADLWRDDEHLAAPSPSLAVVPVHMIHTTEGVGDGHHLLIDIFSPPRADFIARGWVHNADDYRPTEVA
ncbi:MAG: hypothetical protein Q7T70_09410 [Polaromonas sp.]|nr:hypothetical protein [Polaromonas sp.]